MNYYNEWDPFAAAWLRELIAAGLVPAGDVDTRSITEVQPDDLAGYTQCHFFAGIGGWSHALQLAGWPTDRPVWTGSCPCQPFSAAGKGKGEADERHLWPELRRLIAQCHPATCFGEQTGSRLGRNWLAAVRTDLEALGYAVGAADLCAAGVGAPHLRQRLYFVADAHDLGRRAGYGEAGDPRREVGVWSRVDARDGGAVDGKLADTDRAGFDADGRHSPAQPGGDRTDHGVSGEDGALAVAQGDSLGAGLEGLAGDGRDGDEPGRVGADTAGSTAAPGGAPWADPFWVPCRDGKVRPIPAESGLQFVVDGVSGGLVPGGDARHGYPLAQGVPNRVGLLKGAGNAIVPALGAAFIEAYLGVRGE